MSYVKCTKCKKKLPQTLDYFPPSRGNGKLSELGSWCRVCCAKHGKRKRLNNKRIGLCTKGACGNKAIVGKVLCGKCEAVNSSSGRAYRTRLKVEVFSAYGGCVCVCCGEQYIQFLTLDHINGNGNNHRKLVGNKGGYAMYVWAKKNKFPVGFRVLCMNCNLAIGAYGYCPHTREMGAL